MIHPDSEIRHVNAVIGYGVFATRFIPRGTITWVFDELDQVISPDNLSGMSPILQSALEKYSYRNRRGERVLCWDHSRFINHSCDATSIAPGFDFEIAVRDIQAGEQITDDYALLNLESEFDCACGCEACRGVVRPEDFDRFAPRWDAMIVDSARSFRKVDQPLWELVREKNDVLAVLAGATPMPSCRMHQMNFMRSGAAGGGAV